MFLIVFVLPFVFFGLTVSVFSASIGLATFYGVLTLLSVLAWLKCLEFFKRLSDATLYDSYEERTILLTEHDNGALAVRMTTDELPMNSNKTGVKVRGKFENGALFERSFVMGEEVTYFTFLTGNEQPTLIIAKERLNFYPKLGKLLFGSKLTTRTIYDFSFPKSRVNELAHII